MAKGFVTGVGVLYGYYRKLLDFKRNRGVFATYFVILDKVKCERSECVRNEKIIIAAARSRLAQKVQLFQRFCSDGPRVGRPDTPSDPPTARRAASLSCFPTSDRRRPRFSPGRRQAPQCWRGPTPAP